MSAFWQAFHVVGSLMLLIAVGIIVEEIRVRAKQLRCLEKELSDLRDKIREANQMTARKTNASEEGEVMEQT